LVVKSIVHSEALLVTPREKCDPCRRTDGGIGVEIRESDPLAGKSVEIRSQNIPAPVATKISVAKIVGHDENDVWLLVGTHKRGK
jgi:hypothetical protein